MNDAKRDVVVSASAAAGHLDRIRAVGAVDDGSGERGGEDFECEGRSNGEDRKDYGWGEQDSDG